MCVRRSEMGMTFTLQTDSKALVSLTVLFLFPQGGGTVTVTRTTTRWTSRSAQSPLKVRGGTSTRASQIVFVFFGVFLARRSEAQISPKNVFIFL